MKPYDQAFINSRSPRKYSSGFFNGYLNKRNLQRVRKTGLHVFIVPLLLIPSLLFVISQARTLPQNSVATNQQVTGTNIVITATPQPNRVPVITNNSATIKTNESSATINDGMEFGIGGGPGDVLSVPDSTSSATIAQ